VIADRLKTARSVSSGLEAKIALVGEVAKEGGLGQSRALGDLRGGRGVVSPFGEQLDGRLQQSAARVWLPSAHATILL
jgi:hypothetical protein